MNERERLINWAKQLADPNWCLSVPKEAKDVITQLVKELEPRTIATVEELDALPAGTVIRDGDPLTCIKWGDGTWGTFAGDSYPPSRVTLPATVLHEPGPQP